MNTTSRGKSQSIFVWDMTYWGGGSFAIRAWSEILEMESLTQGGGKLWWTSNRVQTQSCFTIQMENAICWGQFDFGASLTTAGNIPFRITTRAALATH